MKNFIRVLRSDDVVPDAQANPAFSLLVPIVERTPTAHDAIEAARELIRRCPRSEDSPLASVLDWWFVVTTGQPSVNGGAHRLPETLDDAIKLPMQEIIHLVESDLVGQLPAAEWMDKKRRFDVCLAGINDDLDLEQYGAVKLPNERDAWAWLRERLDYVADDLRSNRPAEPIEPDRRGFERELRDGGIERNSRRWTEMVKRHDAACHALNHAVELQNQVEPWIQRHLPEVIDELPSDLPLTVGPLATTLLRPLLAHHAADSVRPDDVADKLEEAARAADDKGRYCLARIASEWCEETGQEVEILTPLVERHRALNAALESLEDRPEVDISDIQLHVIDDDIEGAESSLQLLEDGIRRQDRLRRIRGQFEGLRQAIAEAGLGDDREWRQRLKGFESHLETDDSDLPSRIGAAQQQLSELLDKKRHERIGELTEIVDLLKRFGATDSVLSDWSTKIEEVQQRPDGRGANDLHRELAAQVSLRRKQFHIEAQELLSEIDKMLDDQVSDFSETDLGRFANRHSEIENLVGSEELNDDVLIDVRERANTLRSDLDERRIEKWNAADHGEARLVEHLVNYCTGNLDYDETDIRRLHVAVKTKPFVILAGLTGSGKSSLTRLYAAALGATTANGGFRRVAVRPDWIDQSEVLGFVNPMSQRFVPGWLAETIQSCERRPDRLHFILLDEMNLAPVEQYLAELLSAMEESRSGSEQVLLRLYPRGEQPTNAHEWPAELQFPKNLVIVGTVNVDETTRPLSERVIDRANVLHLNVSVSKGHHSQNGPQLSPWNVAYTEWCQVCMDDPSDDHHEFLVEVAGILRPAGIGVGLRAHVELERFVANSVGVMEPESALDWGIVQRIIPKIRGFKGVMTHTLERLASEFDSVGADESARIVRQWLDDRVSDDDYLDGTDPKLTLARVWDRDADAQR